MMTATTTVMHEARAAATTTRTIRCGMVGGSGGVLNVLITLHTQRGEAADAVCGLDFFPPIKRTQHHRLYLSRTQISLKCCLVSRMRVSGIPAPRGRHPINRTTPRPASEASVESSYISTGGEVVVVVGRRRAVRPTRGRVRHQLFQGSVSINTTNKLFLAVIKRSAVSGMCLGQECK